MTTRIRVWYLIGELRVGGTERTLVDLVKGLDTSRFDPTIWTIADRGPIASEVPDDIPVHSLGATSKADVRATIRFARALRREQPDILQSFLFFDNVLARLVGLINPGTTVVTGVREVPDGMKTHRDVADRLTLSLSDYVVSNSRAGFQWVVNRGFSSQRVRVIPNGRNVDSYDVDEPPTLRSDSAIPPGPVVGTVGRLVERKGHHDLLDAWPTVRDECPNVQLVIVGDGPEYGALERHANRLGVEESVHLLGRRDDVPELLAMFDIFAFPSHYEGLPGALLEAMCAGLPIVTTPVDGCSELVEDGRHGLHVPSRSPEQLGDTLSKLISDSQLAETLGSRAQERARSEFSLEAMTRRFEEFYECVSR